MFETVVSKINLSDEIYKDFLEIFRNEENENMLIKYIKKTI